jgi:outer membrane beta-barrel protein
LRQWIVVLLAVLFSAPLAWSQTTTPSEVYDLPQLVAVQGRPYYLSHGLTANIGYLPSDAFNKGYTVGGSYTYYFSDFVGWEVVHANYSINQETKLKRNLKKDFNAEVEAVGFGGVLDYIDYYATSNVVYTPLYNKSLLFNKTVVRGETSGLIGGGAAHFNSTGWKPMVTVGLMLRFFASARTSYVLDVRENVYFDKDTGANGMISMMVGFSYQLGAAPDTDTSIHPIEVKK